MIGRKRRPLKVDTEAVFAESVWDHTTAAWREIDSRMSGIHLAREVDAAVDRLDLSELVASSGGRGTPRLRPDLMLKLVMYERKSGEPSPADWFRDTRENDAVKWLTMGLAREWLRSRPDVNVRGYESRSPHHRTHPANPAGSDLLDAA